MAASISAVIGISAAMAYLAGTVVQLRSFLSNVRVDTRLLVALAAAGAVLHGVANYQAIYTSEGLNLGLVTSASLVSWIMLTFVLLVSARLPVLNLLMLMLPLGALTVLATLLWAPGSAGVIPAGTLDAPLLWHIFLSIGAYSVLFMAACQSVLLGVLEHRLRSRQTLTLLKVLPPLETMEALLFDLLRTGLIALTLAIGSGFLFLDDIFGQRVVHHTVLAIASWCVYAVLLAGHHFIGWRGTTAVRWTLIAFVLLVMAYFGSKFVIEFLLGA